MTLFGPTGGSADMDKVLSLIVEVFRMVDTHDRNGKARLG